MNRKKVKLFILCFSFMLIGVVAYSEITPPKPSAAPVPPGLPIDGGLSFLLISGVAYGIFELKRRK
jgi:hypothetical protein